jgi:hypothetical protein
MLVRSILLSTLLPTCLFAEAYGTPEGCARHAGNGTGVDSAVLWDRGAGEIRFHETRCTIRDVMQVGSGGVNVGGPCSSEGETWDAWFLISSTGDESLYYLTPEQSGTRVEIRLCE